MSGSNALSASPSGINIGSDTKVNLLTNGVITSVQILTSFEARQITEKVTSEGINGVVRVRDVERGWEGTMEWDRADSSLDTLFAAKELLRYQSGVTPDFQIVETTTNVDQSVSKFQYTGVTMTMESKGARTGAAKVSQRASWRASTCLQIQ